MADPVETLQPHVLIFPLPAQGHVNSMLKLAELLCLSDFHVTFLVSDHTHDRLLRHTDVHKRFDHYPKFRLQTFCDGIPAESARSGNDFLTELIVSLKTVIKPFFRELLFRSNCLSSETNRPVTCMITDGVLSFAIDIAEEMGIPIIYFRTISACAFWAYFCIPQLIEAGELPFKGNNLDVPIKSIPGMEAFLRGRDLPGIFRTDDLNNPDFQFVSTETRQTTRAQALILNTFEDLEGPILSHIRIRMPNVYTIGPLHSHHKTRLAATAPPMVATTASNSLWEEDRSCITWLDAQPSESVIYVSFGSIATITNPQLMELWHGLVNSGKRFLWVIRSQLVTSGDGEAQIPVELLEATKERGYVVGWAPQEEVLDHPAVGGFLTHSGWNSTLESIVAGVPMICWPYFVDQQLNSRFVGEVWKLGMDMKDTCDRDIVEKMVKDLMEVKKSELVQSANRMAELAGKAIGKGGSSYCNLDRLIEDIMLWDTFFAQIEPVASKVPYHVCIGNHEYDWPHQPWKPDWSYSVYGKDGGGECGVPYSLRFNMPGNSSEVTGTRAPATRNLYYSFDFGSVHFVYISTETNFLAGSSQYNFIKHDLESVDRKKTPFVVVQGHRPMYTTSNEVRDAPFREKLQEHLEPLFVKNKVTLALWGHVHRYERFCPINNFTCGNMGLNGEDSEGFPVHIVIGMAGQDWQPIWEPRADHPNDPIFPQPGRSLYRGGEFGYTRLVATKEKLTFSYVGNHDGEVHDMVEILASGHVLNGGGSSDDGSAASSTMMESTFSWYVKGASVLVLGAFVGYVIGYISHARRGAASGNNWTPVKNEEI